METVLVDLRFPRGRRIPGIDLESSRQDDEDAGSEHGTSGRLTYADLLASRSLQPAERRPWRALVLSFEMLIFVLVLSYLIVFPIFY